eukprot:scaffold64719_cov37-Tisochrysis_lutea.AAC.5
MARGQSCDGYAPAEYCFNYWHRPVVILWTRDHAQSATLRRAQVLPWHHIGWVLILEHEDFALDAADGASQIVSRKAHRVGAARRDGHVRRARAPADEPCKEPPHILCICTWTNVPWCSRLAPHGC